MTVQKLTERQMRWSPILSKYNFKIVYIGRADNERSDALSRREQDMPRKAGDDRVDYRSMQLLKPSSLVNLPRNTIIAMAIRVKALNTTVELSAMQTRSQV